MWRPDSIGPRSIDSRRAGFASIPAFALALGAGLLAQMYGRCTHASTPAAPAFSYAAPAAPAISYAAPAAHAISYAAPAAYIH